MAKKFVKGQVPLCIGEDVWNSKLTAQQVLEIRKELDAGAVQMRLAEKYGVTFGNISAIARRLTWKHLLTKTSS